MSAQVNNAKSGWVHGLVTVSLILFGLTATGLAQPTTINVPGDQPTIQAAINAAAPGDTVFVSNGTYVLGATLNVTKGITIEGESEAGVVIDASSRGTGYGIYVEANNVTLRKFTVLPPDNDPPGVNGTSTGGGFAIHASFNHAVPYSSLTNLALADITIQNGNRAAFDIHGYDGVTLTGLTAQNSAYGNGIQITGCTDVTITGATVSGNAWGGIAFYASKSTYLNRPCSSITYDMAANPDVDQPVFVEDEYGIDNSVTIANATYLIKNDYGAGISTMWMYTDGTQADAIAIAQALNTKYSNTLSQVTNSTGGLVVAPGLSITIQAAIDAASPGAMVEVAEGTYHEQLLITKALTLKGSDGAVLDGTGLAPTWTTGIKIRCGNVTVDNIDVTKFTQDGITAYDNIDMPNLQIKNCRVSDIQPGYWGFGIYVGYESEGFGNVPPDLTDHLNFSGLLIANNEITNTHSSGLVLQAITGTPGSLVVSNNTVHGISANSGIWIDCGRNLTIVDNNVSNNKWGVEFSAYAEPWYTLDGSYGPKDIVLQGNLIADNEEEGVALYNGWPETITLQENIITGNGTGVANFLSADLDVGRNYWGAADGPAGEGDGSGDTISTGVTYASYYVDSAMTTLVAPVVQVDDDFTPATPGWGEYAFATVQAGINAAAPGGTVNIAAGTYDEVGQINIDKHLDIVGAGMGATIVRPTANTGSSGDARGWFLVDAGITFNLADVTLDGNNFNVYQGIRHKGGGTITDVAFTDMTFPGYGGVAVAAFGDDPIDNNVNISGCTFDEIGRVGVLYYGAGITGSYFTGNTYTGKGGGDWLDYCLDISAGAVVFVDGNTITNCTGIASSDGSESAGILVTSYYGSGTTADIRNNIINGCTMGIAIGYNASDTSTVTLDRNNLADNEYGVYGTIAASASANYWGTADGPSGSGSGSGSAINDQISYNTWYADAAMTQLVYGNVLVDDDFTSGTPGWGLYAFTNIQQGVGAAGASGTVSVNPGTYEEQVEIAKDLLLQGTAPGVVIQSPVTLAKSFTTSAVNKPVVYVHDAMSVTLSNVVVDGLFQGGANYRFMGIAYHNAGGAVLASEVKNIANNPPNGSQHGIGVGVYNVDAAARTFALLDSYLHDCQKNCTVFNGDNLTVDIRRNRVFGAGPIDYIAQNGIQISYGATGTVADNIVSGFDYTPGTWASSAIMNYEGGNVLFENNIVTLSDFGLYIYNSAGSVLTGNSLTGNDYSVVSYATVPIVAENNWWGTPIGPVTEGIYGDVDAEPWLAAKPAHANALYLEASDESLFIKPGESIIVDMNVANLTTNVNACQAMLGYSSTYFDDPTGGAVQAGGGVWDQLIWDIWRDAVGTPGEIDTAIGVDADGAVGTTADGTVAIVTLTSRTNVEGITQMVFRPDADPDPGLTESTFLASITGDPVWPAKVHSCNLVIDGTAPVMDYTNITAVENQPLLGDVSVKDCSNTVYQGTVRISVIASDALAGLTNGVPTIQLVNGGVTNTPAFVGPTAADEFTCEWVVDPATPNGIWTATVTATDYAGNETQLTFTLCVNRNQISGYVQSEGFVGGNRVVTFVATGGASTKTWNQTLTFTDDTAAFALTDVPDGTTGLSAKSAWSLRSKLPVTPDSGEAIASFEDADMLRGGDIDNSNSVNVLDYSKLKVNWLTTNPVGDIDGNGSVGASDYSLMRLNWFQVGDPQ